MQFESPTQAVAAAIRSIFERWTALTLTIQHQCGGAPDRAKHLLDTTVNMAVNTRTRHTEQHFVDLFYAEFDAMDTDIEDGSPEQVAAHIVRIRDDAVRGDFASAIEIIQQSKVSSNLYGGSVDGSQLHTENSMASADDDEMNDEFKTPQQQVVDEDGFVEVRRGRRNRQPPQRFTS